MTQLWRSGSERPNQSAKVDASEAGANVARTWDQITREPKLVVTDLRLALARAPTH
jgi:hypothetical protein